MLKKQPTNLKILYSKLAKLASKQDIQRNEVAKKSKELVTTEEQLKIIQESIFEKELNLYNINLADLHLLLSKKLDEKEVNSLMQACIKYAVSIYENKESTKEESIIPIVSCTCEGRMNVCYSENDELPQCPISSKPFCDGKLLNAIFVKRKN